MNDWQGVSFPIRSEVKVRLIMYSQNRNRVSFFGSSEQAAAGNPLYLNTFTIGMTLEIPKVVICRLLGSIFQKLYLTPKIQWLKTGGIKKWCFYSLRCQDNKMASVLL